jgi:hypothetical protein
MQSKIIKYFIIETNVKSKQLCVSKTNRNKLWINAYLFHYDNVDKERLLQIINKND